MLHISPCRAGPVPSRALSSLHGPVSRGICLSGAPTAHPLFLLTWYVVHLIDCSRGGGATSQIIFDISSSRTNGFQVSAAASLSSDGSRLQLPRFTMQVFAHRSICDKSGVTQPDMCRSDIEPSSCAGHLTRQ